VEYKLEENWDIIGSASEEFWKRKVKEAVENQNKEKMLEECYSSRFGNLQEKTKTKCMIEHIENANYSRTRDYGVLRMTRLKARAIIMARYGMLDFASNFENKYGKKNCDECGAIDDESHRINHCKKWQEINYHNVTEKVNIELVHSVKKSELECISDVILSIWDLKNGNNAMVQNYS
jgi:hypothetical protein